MNLLAAWDRLARDLRFSLRSLYRKPGFTFASVSPLAIGFALTASAVAAVDAYLIRSLPYAGADRLYRVRYAPPGPWEPSGMSSLDWRSVGDVVEFPITSAGETFYLSDGGFSQAARGLRVGRGFVDGLGVRAVIGRSLDETDFSGARGERSALIGHALWRERYGGDPSAVGRLLRVETESSRVPSETLRIVGVLPPGFYFGRDSGETVDVMVPLASTVRTYMVRLRAGVDPGSAEERITAAARQVTSDLPVDWTGVHLEGAHELYVAQLRPALLGITVACGLVLVIACANVAVLMLLRTMRRRKELAVRAALGCGRGRLARLLVLEAALVCAAATATGLLTAAVALRALQPLFEAQLGRPAPGGVSAISVDGTVLLIVGATGVALALAISVLPLLTIWGRPVADILRRGDATSSRGHSMRRMRSALVMVEVAVTLVLLVGCGLMVRSVVAMLHTDLGFESEGVIRARIVLRGSDYADEAAFARFYEAFTHRLSETIQAPVAFSNWPPFAEPPVHVVETRERGGQGMPAGRIAVGAGYFAALGIPLRSGRDIATTDAFGSEPVVVISETLARRLWSEAEPVGRYLREVEPTPHGSTIGPWRRVIAVAGDVRQAYGDSELGDIYVPLSRMGRFGSFYVRTDQSAALLTDAIRRIAAGLDPRAVAEPARPVAGQNQRLEGAQFLAKLLSGFAAIALLLAVVAIYGVTAYAVQQRERETAIRMALGANAGAVVRLFLKEAGAVLAAGMALGLVAAVTAARILESQLYGVRGTDVGTLAVTGLFLASAGVFATWWPARRATLRDPITSLKEG